MLGLRKHGVRGLSRWGSRASPAPCIAVRKDLGYARRQFLVPRILQKKQEPQDQDEKKGIEKPTIRAKARQTSLRSVGIAAAKKRQFIQDKGGLRIIDPDIKTKVWART